MPASRTTTSAALDGDLDPARFAYLLPAGSAEVFSLGRLADLTRTLASRWAEWEPTVRFDPERRWRHRLDLDLPTGWEAWLLSWLPGQGTGPHDHGDAPAVFTVLRGRLEERAIPAGRAGPLRRQLVEAGQQQYWAPRHVRELSNPGPAPAVSLHVYAAPVPSLRVPGT